MRKSKEKKEKKEKLEVVEDKKKTRRNTLDSQSILVSSGGATSSSQFGFTSLDDRRKPKTLSPSGTSAGELHVNISVYHETSPPSSPSSSLIHSNPLSEEMPVKRAQTPSRREKQNNGDPFFLEREKMLQQISELQNESIMLKGALEESSKPSSPSSGPKKSVQEMNATELMAQKLLLESEAAYMALEMDNLQKCLNSTIPKVSNDVLKELLLISASEAKNKKNN